VLQRVPAGEQTIVVRWLGFRRRELSVTVTAGGSHTVDAALEPQPVTLADVIVEGVSRTPERIVEAPAAASVVDPVAARALAATSQPARAFTNLTGVDVAQNDMNDYNVNSRGFNSSFNRRVLVLQDGRDLAVPFLGAQEWNAMTIPMDQMSRVEFVRGPGSALYGVNAYSGVINFITPSAREVVGTKLNLAGGNLSSSRVDLAHAGVFGEGRFGYKLNLGYNRSSSWSVSRTSADKSRPAARIRSRLRHPGAQRHRSGSVAGADARSEHANRRWRPRSNQQRVRVGAFRLLPR
jgi:iron complex outermembrane receptor protein